MARSARAQSSGQRCTFWGFPAFGKFQMTKSPVITHFFSGNHVQRWSSVSPRPWRCSRVTPAIVSVIVSATESVTSATSGGRK